MTTQNNILHDTGITCTVAVRKCPRKIISEKMNKMDHGTVAMRELYLQDAWF
jgi:hypothetical protein